MDARMQGQTAAKAMSPAEMAEYEEKKLKMRKAMGENLHDDVQGTASGLANSFPVFCMQQTTALCRR